MSKAKYTIWIDEVIYTEESQAEFTLSEVEKICSDYFTVWRWFDVQIEKVGSEDEKLDYLDLCRRVIYITKTIELTPWLFSNSEWIAEQNAVFASEMSQARKHAIISASTMGCQTYPEMIHMAVLKGFPVDMNFVRLAYKSLLIRMSDLGSMRFRHARTGTTYIVTKWLTPDKQIQFTTLDTEWLVANVVIQEEAINVLTIR